MPAPIHPFFIAIEGNIGAGKTTLAKRLAKETGGKLILENFEANEHLKKFYSEPHRYAVAAERRFLVERFIQLNNAFGKGNRRSNKIIIADYYIGKCMTFARVNLTRSEFAVWEKYYNLLFPLLPSPSLLIYLEQPIKQLRANIRKRNRPYEQRISETYLKKIQKEYNRMLQTFTSGSIIPIDCTNQNPLLSDNFERLKWQIINHYKAYSFQ